MRKSTVSEGWGVGKDKMCFPNVQELQMVTFCVNIERFYTKLGKNTNLTIFYETNSSNMFSLVAMTTVNISIAHRASPLTFTVYFVLVSVFWKKGIEKRKHRNVWSYWPDIFREYCITEPLSGQYRFSWGWGGGGALWLLNIIIFWKLVVIIEYGSVFVTYGKITEISWVKRSPASRPRCP